MNFILHPWHLLVLALAGWVNREQLQIIEYLKIPNPGYFFDNLWWVSPEVLM